MSTWHAKLDIKDLLRDYDGTNLWWVGERISRLMERSQLFRHSPLPRKVRIASCRNIQMFDRILAEVYTYADEHRIWLGR